MENNQNKEGVVLVVDGRYFAYIKKNIVTAWSLAGAKIFLKDSPALLDAEKILIGKGYKPIRKTVCVID
jgi:hypothetical protein